MSKRINVILSDEPAAVPGRGTTRGGRSHSGSKSVLPTVKSSGKHSLRQQVKTGYLANAEDSLKIASEWFPLEEELFVSARRPPGERS